MKCINCGAEVTGGTCEYCGTHYDINKGFVVKIGPEHTGTLKIGNEQYKVYIDEVKGTLTKEVSMGRDFNGKMMMMPGRIVRTFILKEL